MIVRLKCKCGSKEVRYYREQYHTIFECLDCGKIGNITEFDNGEFLYATDTPQLLKALQKYGMLPELLGRIPVIARLKSLTQGDLRRILTDSDESVLRQYEKDFAAYGIGVSFDDSAYDAISERAYQRNMGARGLGAVVEESLSLLKFHLPGTEIEKLDVTAETIQNPLETTLNLIQEHKKRLGGAKE